jgi:bacteriorhodopsin
MIRELTVLALFLFTVCVVCWLVAPSVLGSFSASQSFTMRSEGVAFMVLPLVLFVIIGAVIFKSRSGD